MIAFKFGSIVYVQPRRHPTRTLIEDTPSGSGVSSGAAGGDHAVGTASASHAASAASRAAEKVAAAAASQLQQELTRAVRTAVTDPVLTKARIEGGNIRGGDKVRWAW